MKKILIVFVLAIILAVNVSACVVDSDCGEPGEWVYENKCIYQVHQFNPVQQVPDPYYLANMNEADWHYFILNGILANFEIGRQYTWAQQTRYREINVCEDDVCVKEKEYKKKSCTYACDFGSTEQCMCPVKDLSSAQCLPNKSDIYVLRQLPYKNSDGECEQTGYELAYVCPTGYPCNNSDGSATCKKERTDEAGVVSYIGYNYKTTNTKISTTGKGMSREQFMQRYGYDPISTKVTPSTTSASTPSRTTGSLVKRPATIYGTNRNWWTSARSYSYDPYKTKNNTVQTTTRTYTPPTKKYSSYTPVYSRTSASTYKYTVKSTTPKVVAYKTTYTPKTTRTYYARRTTTTNNTRSVAITNAYRRFA